ncbi:NfeD family protein [Streptomyces misionensis]|uniref:NfeD family protein n=1 Tax=Streptomyces misionensis TaxID=67331 RepID=UPI0036A72935
MGSILDTNTSPDGVRYATREDIMRALDVQTTARNRRQIDDAIEAASRGVEGLCHRRFAPVLATRYFDWPGRPAASYTPWVLRLDDSELISLTSITSGGISIPLDDVNLEPNRSGPPFSRVEIKLNTSAAYGGGQTYQRDVTITGLWGYRDTETTLGAATAAVGSGTTLTVDGATSAAVGVGSILRVDDERMLVTERAQADTGQTGTLTASKADTTLTVTDGTAFAVDEVLLLDSERVRVDDIAGNTLVVERAYDGTVLAAHTSTPIYAPRALTVTRGALGTTATTHTTGATAYEWQPPGLIHQLVKAEAIWSLLQERSGWFRLASSSGKSAPEVSRVSIDALRDQAYTEYGRKARTRGI